MPYLVFAAPSVISASLVIVGIIHLLPLVGLLGADRLAAVYGIAFDEPNLAILMRHRAVLFGLMGGFMVCAAVKPSWQGMGLAIGFISLVSFLALAYSIGGYNAHVGRVVAIDWFALACLLLGAAAFAFT